MASVLRFVALCAALIISGVASAQNTCVFRPIAAPPGAPTSFNTAGNYSSFQQAWDAICGAVPNAAETGVCDGRLRNSTTAFTSSPITTGLVSAPLSDPCPTGTSWYPLACRPSGQCGSVGAIAAYSVPTTQVCEEGAAVPRQNITVGWATRVFRSKEGEKKEVEMSDAMPTYVSACVVGCEVNFAPTGADYASDPSYLNVWTSQQPASNGMYRVSVDWAGTNMGRPCQLSDANNPANPNSTPRACPGTVGQVNGVTTCVGTFSGNTVKMAGKAGNPKAATRPTDLNSAREPSPSQGGGPDARGGPGVTKGVDGSVGTGSDRTAGQGDGSSNTPTDPNTPSGTTVNVELKTCGTPDTPKCKIDETGTPNGQGAFEAATTTAQATEDALKGVPDQVVGEKGDTTWRISWGIPTGCTNPPALNLPRAGLSWTPDMCQHQGSIHAVMTALWLMFTVSSCVYMVRSTITGGG